MSYRAVISVAAVAILGIACVSTDALAYRGGYRGGVRVGGVHHAGVYRRGYVHRGVGVGVGVGAAAVGAAAVGAALAAPYYYNRAVCGYPPYQPCY
jgi:hypothetical protein